MDNGFEILPAAASVRIRVWGSSVKELFRNALRGVGSYLRNGTKEIAKGAGSVRQEINVRAVDLNSLLIEFLTETLAQADIHGAVFHAISFKDFGENFLKGSISGIKVDEFEKDIKAISDNGIDIKKNPDTGRYETVFSFEV